MPAPIPSPRPRIARGFGSLRNRLILLVALAMLPAAGLLLFTGLEERRAEAERVRSQSDRLAGFAAAATDHLIAGTRDLLVGLSAAPSLEAADPKACNDFMGTLLPSYPQYANLAAALPNGNLFCSAVPVSTAVSVADAPYFRQAIETGTLSVGAYQVDPVIGDHSLNLGWPVVEADGEARLVLIATLKLSELQTVASGISLPAGSAVSVTDRDGTIVARQPDAERWVGRQAPDYPEEPAVATLGPEELRGVDGVERLYTFVPLQSADGDLVLRLGIPTTVAFAEVTARLVRNLAGLGVVALLAIAAAWWMGDLLIVRRVRRLSDAADRVTGGDLSVRSGAKSEGGDEIDSLGRTFDGMARALHARQDEAESAAESLQRSQAALQGKLDELRIAHQQREEALSQMVTAQEQERVRVAADIHDDSIQVMSAVGLRLERLRRRLFDPGHLRLLQELQGTVVNATARLRHLVFQLHPPALDRDGLAAAIGLYLREVCEGTNCTYEVLDRLVAEPPADTRLILFRIAQEAANNMRKHSHASHVEVLMEPSDGGYLMVISDDGDGFSPERIDRPEPGHLGLSAMRGRAERAGGWWRVDSQPGRGTAIEFWLPGRRGVGDPNGPAPASTGVAS